MFTDHASARACPSSLGYRDEGHLGHLPAAVLGANYHEWVVVGYLRHHSRTAHDGVPVLLAGPVVLKGDGVREACGGDVSSVECDDDGESVLVLARLGPGEDQVRWL